MGHSHFLELPRSVKWKHVTDLIDAGAEVEQIVSATVEAADQQLRYAIGHQALTEAVALIRDLGRATDAKGMKEALDGIGLRLTDSPSAIELAIAVSEKLERETAQTTSLPDFAEITRRAAVGTLLRYCNEAVAGTSDGKQATRKALSELATPAVLNDLMDRYFGSVASATVMYYLSRELPSRVGGGRRFPNLDALDSFSAQLSLHCLEAAKGRSRLAVESGPSQLTSLITNRERQVKEYAVSTFASVLQRLRLGSATA